MAVYVGRWDCTSCGYKGVIGPETECSNCGADRPKNVKFYMADEKDIVQDPDVLQKAKEGPDWRCSYCGQNNKNAESTCKDCGNPRGVADKQLDVKDYSTQNVPRSGDGTRSKPQAQVVAEPPKTLNKKGCFFILAILISLAIALSWSHEIEVQVESFEWERTIRVEENKKIKEEGWSLPQGGELITSFREIHHYEQVLDHYETRTRTQQRATGTEEYVCGKRDLGNGYFEDKYCTRTTYESYEEEYQEPIYRDEPVYQTKYSYWIYRWLISKPIVTTGKNQEPIWGDTYDIKTQSNLREAGRKGMYAVIVRDEKAEIHRHEMNFSKWERLSIGANLKAKRGTVLGGYRGLVEE
ncbi:hypothetical protein [Aureispira anguillae]|uniref:RanBP2-type domain-containing protein n=1 Tax=Aureispira anguillae TaxID=2864201 RepID=A0A916DWT3_9BACT|nr:hypothetical protein [Aureispira anguillae]BDS15040.1 hypothetical protein AsAng_0058220 [Aureispira anguillae]